ncbi:MAG TPA: TMEM165/GDT1 family protein, partial [Streptosporangiaceae bacterium]|nr:TMEM165/GDT1 family protein [Streptosporangiaceae bacterium]
MSLAVGAVAFTLVLPAELPDKTAFASLVLGTRHRPLPVFAGVAAAFAVHTCLAVVAGGLLSLLPHRALDAVVAALFLLSAWLLWRRRGQGEGEAPDRAVAPGFLPVAAASFAIVMVAEFGDLTQIGAGAFGVLQQGRLGNLDLEAMRRQIGGGERLADEGGYVGALELNGRDVDRHGSVAGPA